MKTFYSYNKIFDYALTAKSKLVYIYLCSMVSRKAVCFPSRKTIATACSLSLESVKRAAKELAAAGLIAKAEQYRKSGRQTSNLYTVVREAADHYFSCESMIFEQEISTNTKLVYTYIQRCASQEGSFPSYRKIAEKCDICVSTAVRSIKELLACGLITKESQWRENGGRKNNRYHTTPCNNENDAHRESSRCASLPEDKKGKEPVASLCYLSAPPYVICEPPGS